MLSMLHVFGPLTTPLERTDDMCASIVVVPGLATHPLGSFRSKKPARSGCVIGYQPIILRLDYFSMDMILPCLEAHPDLQSKILQERYCRLLSYFARKTQYALMYCSCTIGLLTSIRGPPKACHIHRAQLRGTSGKGGTHLGFFKAVYRSYSVSSRSMH